MTPSPRQTAALIDRDKKSLERIGVPAAAAVGKVLTTQVTAAFNDHASQAVLVAMISRYMNRLQPVILDGMVAGHLSGRARAIRMSAQGLAANRKSMGAYDEALDYYKKRMKLSPDDIERLRKLYGNEAAKTTRSASDLVERRATAAIQESIEKGEHIKDAMARLQTAFESAGIVEPSPFLCETLCRTGISQGYAAGQYNAMADPALQEMHTGWVYVTTGDMRVRDTHAELDGMTAAQDNEVWEKYLPPLGFNCRCTAIPLFSDFEEYIPDPLPEPDEGWGYDKRSAFTDHFNNT